jgi:L-amino acid N-acyltransferase
MIRPAVPNDARAIADLLNHWIETSAITLNPVPKSPADIRAMIAAKATAGHAFPVAEDHARAQGAHQMIAGISGENGEGRAFHERFGYRHVATVLEAGYKFGRYIGLVLMQKIL